MSSDVKQVFGTAFIFVGQALGFTPVGVFAYAAGAALLASGARQARKEAEHEARVRALADRTSRSVKANIRGSSETHYLIFGKVRVGGLMVMLRTNSVNSKILHIGLAHSLSHSGGCEGIGAIWLNEEKIATTDLSGNGQSSDAQVTLAKYVDGSTYLVKFRHYRGTGTQSADTTSGDSLTDYRRGIAWTRFTLTRPDDDEKFQKAFPQGVPNISVEFSGLRCYDPRLDSTNGGSGSHRYGDPTTWAWTQNPALIAATYSIMEVSDGGMGYAASRIDWPSVAAAANICDETATSTDSPTVSFTRYQCNIALDTGDSRETNLRKILETMQGVRVKVGDKFKFYAGAYSAPTFTLDHTYLRGAVKMSTRSPLEQLYNAVRVVHDDADQNFRTVEAPPFTSASYEAQDGNERLWKEVALHGVTNTHQAQYIGQIIGAQSRKQKILEVPCNLKALDIEAWETGTVTLDELGLSGAVYRVVSWQFEEQGPVLVLREEGSDVYNTSALSTPSAASATSPSTETPDTPAGVSATGVLDGITIAWTGPDANSIKQIDIYRADTSSPTTYSLIASAVGYRYTDPVLNGATYYYKLKSRNYQGATSDFSSEVSATARTQATATSQGDGVPVVDEFDADTNEQVFRPLVAGDGVEIQQTQTGVQIDATTTERDHLVLHSDRASSSTTLGDVSDFKFTLEPNSVYEIEVTGLIQSAATGTGFKFGATAPSGTVLMSMVLETPGASGSTTGETYLSTGTTAVSATTTAVPTANTTYPFLATFTVVTGPESGSPTTGFVGDFQIQHATETGGTAVTLKQYTYMVISKLSTLTPSAALTLAAPGFDASYSATLSDVAPGPITSSLTLTCKTDGTWSIARAAGASGSGSTLSGNWGTPTTAGAGSDYEVKFTYSGHNGVGTVSNAAPDWTTVSVNRAFSLTVSTNSTATGSLTIQMQVRKRGTTTPTSDGSTSWTVTASLTS